MTTEKSESPAGGVAAADGEVESSALQGRAATQDAGATVAPETQDANEGVQTPQPDPETAAQPENAQPVAPPPAPRTVAWRKWLLPAVGVVVLAAAAGVAAFFLLESPDQAWENCKSMEARTPEQRVHDCGAVILAGEKPPRAMAQAYRIRGRAFFDLGEVTSAVRDYSEALAVVTDDATLYSERGFAHLRNGQPDKAVEDFNAAIGLDASQVESLVGRGNAYLSLRQPEAAAQDFSVALTLKPDLGEAVYRRALANVRMNRIADAAADYDRALELSPKMPSYWNARCWFRATMSIDLDLALADCDTALKLKPGFAPALDSRAFVLLRLGRLADAKAAYDKAIAAETRYAWPYFGRGIVKKRLGDDAGAQADFAKAQSLQPDIAQQYANYGEQP